MLRERARVAVEHVDRIVAGDVDRGAHEAVRRARSVVGRGAARVGRDGVDAAVRSRRRIDLVRTAERVRAGVVRAVSSPGRATYAHRNRGGIAAAADRATNAVRVLAALGHGHVVRHVEDLVDGKREVRRTGLVDRPRADAIDASRRRHLQRMQHRRRRRAAAADEERQRAQKGEQQQRPPASCSVSHFLCVPFPVPLAVHAERTRPRCKRALVLAGRSCSPQRRTCSHAAGASSYTTKG